MPATPLFPACTNVMRLPYYTNTGLAVPVTGLAINHIFSANGLYDPDITATGTQPMGFDQMMVFYEHYTVTKAKIYVTFRNFSTTMSPIVFIAVRGDLTGFTDPKTIMETGNTVSTQLMPASITGSLKELAIEVDVRRFLGIDDLKDSHDARGDIASNPTEGVFFHVGGFNNEAASAGSVNFQVRIEYHALFSESRVITPSLFQGFHALLKCSEQKN